MIRNRQNGVLEFSHLWLIVIRRLVQVEFQFFRA